MEKKAAHKDKNNDDIDEEIQKRTKSHSSNNSRKINDSNNREYTEDEEMDEINHENEPDKILTLNLSNCKLEHTSNYGGCKVYQQNLKEKVEKIKKRNENSSIQKQ